MSFSTTAPEAYASLLGLSKYVSTASVSKQLAELIKVRVAQVNGCAYCIDVHTTDARKHGESETRLYALAAWRESPAFEPSERAVLALTDAVTLISQSGVPDEVWRDVGEHYSEREVADILHTIITINAFTRLAVATRMVAGQSKPVKPQAG
nr:carboxymuconolactone decarboxylase family protein [uncultured Nocardioides sp.]